MKYEYRVVDARGFDTRNGAPPYTDRVRARGWKRQLSTNFPSFGPYKIQRRGIEWEDCR